MKNKDYNILVDEIFSDIRKLNKEFEDFLKDTSKKQLFSQYSIEECDKIEKKIICLSLDDLYVLKDKIDEANKKDKNKLMILDTFIESVTLKIRALELHQGINSYKKTRRGH